MPRREEIEAAIAAHNNDEREKLLLPPIAACLLAVMFPRDTVFRRSVASLRAEGFDRRTLRRLVEALVETGFLSRDEQRRRGIVCPYRLHLPPRRRP